MWNNTEINVSFILMSTPSINHLQRQTERRNGGQTFQRQKCKTPSVVVQASYTESTPVVCKCKKVKNCFLEDVFV